MRYYSAFQTKFLPKYVNKELKRHPSYKVHLRNGFHTDLVTAVGQVLDHTVVGVLVGDEERPLHGTPVRVLSGI